MKKLFAIIATVLITCGITVAPAFAEETDLEGGDVIDGIVYVHEPIPADTPVVSDDPVVISDDTNTDDTDCSPKVVGELAADIGVVFLAVLVSLLVVALATPWICRDETEEEKE